MKSLVLLPSIASLATAFCGHGTSLHPRDDHTPAPISTFGYDGITGPLGWHALNMSANSLCALGKHQSPINIIKKDYPCSTPPLNFTFDDYPHGAEIENLGTTLEVFINGSMSLPQPPCDGGARGKCTDKLYKLRQFHFHSSSEHHIEGVMYPMEVHFVFQADDATLSVVGIPIDIDESRGNGSDHSADFLSQVFAHVDEVAKPGSVGQTGGFSFAETGLGKKLAESRYFRYSGSLTTPPCSEGVTWSVVQSPLHIQLDTYNKVRSIMGYNARYIQNALGEINLLDNARKTLDQEAL
ncbi:carbonate dehydratase [Coniochaeta sp. 2T2.1]|nr:carbonate dehydratase [Coniochaeta sp. 2T2.1]